MRKDYYGILGVEKTASAEEIKKAYRRLAREYHPDVSDKPNAEEKLKEINEAYEILKDPQKRQEYDNPSPFGFNFVDMMRGFGPRHRGHAQADRPQRGRDVRFNLTLSLGEALFGTETNFNYTYKKTCPECNGIGGTELDNCTVCNGQGIYSTTRVEGNTRFTQTTTCNNCGGMGSKPTKVCEECEGLGHVEASKHLSVKIPAGVKNGDTLTVRGQGLDGLNGGPQGDLHFVMEVTYPDMDNLEEEDIEMLRKILWPEDEKME